VSGKVVRLTSFGAFVEIVPGVDGLVHISEMSHTRRVLKPDDVVQVGDMVQVVIKSIDMDSKRISLSIKDALGDPWTGASAKYGLGLIVEGCLEKKEKFGLFINLWQNSAIHGTCLSRFPIGPLRQRFLNFLQGFLSHQLRLPVHPFESKGE
jgi:ribosomal protein S1